MLFATTSPKSHRAPGALLRVRLNGRSSGEWGEAKQLDRDTLRLRRCVPQLSRGRTHWRSGCLRSESSRNWWLRLDTHRNLQ